MTAKYSQLSGKELIKALQKVGFLIISQKGSHIKLRKISAPIKTVVVPNHRIIRPGTLNNILKLAQLDRDKLQELFKK
ncbi:MAG: type II toxin-antitoxin system HicA family toxin [Candidatus Berkelbacteria bacterium]|nr:type II toxin-antitoxin system HicA family toxin [Candidatus Berkelbacteria bacterium]